MFQVTCHSFAPVKRNEKFIANGDPGIVLDLAMHLIELNDERNSCSQFLEVRDKYVVCGSGVAAIAVLVKLVF